MAIQLIMDGMKLQPCNPGFVDGRDAILQADALNNVGVNECLIWNVFAQRGLGYSADQGSPFDRFDQIEAFDLPPACLSVGVDERQAVERGFNLKPNPANGQVQLMLAQPFGMDATVRILGADGRVVRSDQLRSGSITFDLDLAGIAPALYVVELSAGEVVLKERLVVN